MSLTSVLFEKHKTRKPNQPNQTHQATKCCSPQGLSVSGYNRNNLSPKYSPARQPMPSFRSITPKNIFSTFFGFISSLIFLIFDSIVHFSITKLFQAIINIPSSLRSPAYRAKHKTILLFLAFFAAIFCLTFVTVSLNQWYLDQEVSPVQ